MNQPSTGIRFHVDGATTESGRNSRFMGTVTLKAHFNNKDIWDAVIERLNGLEIYRGGGIETELINILQGQVDILEAELANRGTEDKQRAYKAEAALSLAEADKVRAQQQAELLKAQLDMRTRELEDASKANSAWKAWYDAHQRICHSAY